MSEELKDIDLYRKVLQNKDSSALRKLYQKYEKLIYSFSYKMTGDREVAEEVIQEVFLKLWKKHAPYDESKGKFSSWLLTMTRNASLDAIRKRNRHESVEYIEKDSLRVTHETPEDIMEWKEKGSAVRDCINQLKEDQQHIVHLAYYKGKTQKAISKSTDTPLGTVKGRIRLALKHLQQCLQGKGGHFE
ncbi:RNA polymerase sigma factor [Rossellomorea vietnamensis]|uniref:Sigma-70 family RNA polymerase sigma factor n=1 Tax=Rossellomorea aquimaris TaxID=189382 RepID=A0A5D4U0J4_9BACI|nr:sigma-70 family RNA polymerase sigma factor [Rossellomorea aquimaris]TYS80825.1 sigma-70 family RNA polymerase sigma factor [Rossellomorea aquimaris]